MNLTAELTTLIEQLEPIARPGGTGRVLMLMGSGKTVGTSTIARELARLAAARSARGVWLYDLAFGTNEQRRATRADGPVFDAGFGAPAFWATGHPDEARLVARQSAVPRLFVSEFQSRQPVRGVSLRPAPDYWRHVRTAVDLAIIDVPGDTTAALALVGDMDGVFLVADEQSQAADRLVARRKAIETRGGLVSGIVYNRIGRARSVA
ncbi:hypothetical protein RMQ97_08170 [Maricaulis sp. D1M11]|uniref:hypothetical protein n=1 Tax=Maricaulis sp. D1M11 TaxID=3076117 RepID=UPI0039B58DF9